MSITIDDITRWDYNCRDVHYTLEVATTLLELYDQLPKKLQSFYNFQQYELMPALLDIMETGVRIDLDKKTSLLKELSELQEAAKTKLQELLDEPDFNPNSSLQIKKVCVDLFKMEPILSKKGTSTFGAEAMVVYLDRYPLLKVFLLLLLEYRSLKVFVSTFLSADVDEDGRMRCWYAIAGTKTYRLASTKNVFGSGMNLQNVPEKGKMKLKYCLEQVVTEDGFTSNMDTNIEVDYNEELSSIQLPNCKSLFIPDINCTFFDIDYSGADAMVVAWDSDCSWLKNFFRTSTLKLYIYIAQEYLQREITTADPLYKKFKQFIHLTNYGGGFDKAGRAAGIPRLQAKHLQNFYFSKCPEIPAWHKDIADSIATKGYIENVFGARGYFLDRNDPNLLNKAYAWIPQSTIGILVNKGLVNLYKNEKKEMLRYKRELSLTKDIARFVEHIRNSDRDFYSNYTDKEIAKRDIIQVLMQTHDSLSGQYANTDLIAKAIIKAHMSIKLDYKDPLIIPAGLKTSTTSYGDCS